MSTPTPTPAPVPTLTENICIPIHLDAFALSPDISDGPSKLAPYTQPNYVALRLTSNVIQHDVLEHVDFHLSTSSTKNTRLQDLGSKDASVKLYRLGVHLHWSVPRFYRSAISTAQKTTPPKDQGSVPDKAQPSFPSIPNRWLVIRDLQKSEPQHVLPRYQGWIIESDVVRKITEIPGNVDLESDATPFVSYTGSTDDLALKSQAEIFLGQKFDLNGWSESSRDCMALTVMNSSNPLFPDYALHNTNVLSMIDNFQYTNGSGAIDYCTSATASYYVLGWHSQKQDDPFVNVSPTLSSQLSQLRLKLDPNDAGATKDSKLAGSVRCLSHGAIYNVVYDRRQKPTSLADQAALKFTKASDMEPLSVGTTTLDAILTFLKAHRANDDSFFTFPASPTDGAPTATTPPTTTPTTRGATTGTTTGSKIVPHTATTSTPPTPATGGDGSGTSTTTLEGSTGGTTTGGQGGTTMPTKSLPTKVANDLLQISSLMYATADEYDARTQAVDLIAQQNYAKADGGVRWSFYEQTKLGDSPLVPAEPLPTQLRDLNAAQAKLNACERKLLSIQWNLFAEWWKFVSRSYEDPAAQDAAVLGPLGLKQRVSQLEKQYTTLDGIRNTLQTSVDTNSKAMAVKKSSNNYFYQRLDPTLCIAGIDPGRPKDFMDFLLVRESHQLDQDTTSAKAMFKDIKGKDIALPFPTDNKLSETAIMVLAECMKNSSTTNTSLTTGYRVWGAQNPFVPLFLEWEATYYHVDNAQRDAWDVDFRASPVAPANHQLRYYPKAVLSKDTTNQNDTRDVSGRVLILPQPAFNLEATVKQVLAGTNPDMTLTPDQVTDVLNNIRNMQFISAPLSGLTNHLLTRCEGAHVKPNVRAQGQSVIPSQAAIGAASPLGVTQDTLRKVDAETALTPYGTLTDFANDYYPFKPVTQGQLIFTKLNIVDKFGQAVCVPTPKPRRRKELPQASAGIYPCLSDYLTPEIRDGALNTVVELPGAKLGTGDPGDADGSGTWPLCQYVQLTPSINQDARMNLAFLVPDDDSRALCPWRVATDYEQPIFGWIVINYADYGLQFFLSTGQFYREIRMGGANNTNIGPKYVPLAIADGDKASVTNPSASNAQLDQLIALFTGDQDYLQAWFDMIDGAIGTMPFPPGDYGAYANSIVGKPLALVNIGYSLELAEPAIIAQNTLGKSRAADPNFKYPKSPDPAFDDKLDPLPAFQADLESYTFPVKLGDSQRSYDGVVGFYDTSNSLKDKGAMTWGKLHTYFMPEKANEGFVSIDQNPYPLVNPYYLPPESTDNFLLSTAQKFHVKTALIDPYTPLHVYSPILPSVALQLPAWTVQTAMKNMSAFFHLGPSLLTQDVPASAFSQSATTATAMNSNSNSGTNAASKKRVAVTPSTTPTPAPAPAPTPTPAPAPAPAPAPDPTAKGTIPPSPMPAAPPTILLPLSGRKGTWSWLQPYVVPTKTQTSPASESAGTQPSTGTTGTGTIGTSTRTGGGSTGSGSTGGGSTGDGGGSTGGGSTGGGSTGGGSQPQPTPTPPPIPEPTYSTWLVEEDQGQVKFAAAPYTFVEGFLQLAGNLGAGGQTAAS